MDPKYFKQITQGGPIEDIMWTSLLCKIRLTSNIVKHSNTKNHKAAVREIERRNKALYQSSNNHKAGLKKHFQMETDDNDGEAQTNSESESKSEADTDSNNLSELSSDYQGSLSEISEDVESIADAILETDIDHEILG
ncbi:hypothetical protein BY996DRAFT_6411397 [Phakopsora pachyrhizi]|nr:hypothetical protein BY996DRAFT_6411397 [Phakopsora pachyrhizi]